MVVGFDLHQDVHRLLMVGIVAAFRVGEETAGFVTHDHRGVVFVRRQNVVVVTLVGVFDHLEQGFVLLFAIDGPAGVENFVAAVLRVGLREHHQFHVGRVTAQRAVVFQQVIHFIVGQRQTQALIGGHQRVTATGQNIDGAQRRWFGMREQASGGGAVIQHDFHHTVVQYSRSRCTVGGTDAAHIVGNTAFQTFHAAQTTVVSNVGGFGRPGRNGAKTRNHQEQFAGRLLHVHFRAVAQNAFQHLTLVTGQCSRQLSKVHEFGVHTAHLRQYLLQFVQDFGLTEGRQRRCATQLEHCGITPGSRGKNEAE